MGHIFISYSHKDKAYAHKLQRHLQEKGFESWIDDRIDFGARWPHEIEKRLRECDAFILVMSPNSHDSEWVQNELMLARELKKRIFPLLLDGEAWWHVRTTQYVNVQGGKLPPASFFVSLAEASPRSVNREVPAQAEKNGAGGMPSINFYGDVPGNIIIGDGNQLKSAQPGRGALAQPDKSSKTPKIKTEVVIVLIGLVGTIITALAAWAASPTFLAMLARPTYTATFAPSATAALPVITSTFPASPTVNQPVSPTDSPTPDSLATEIIDAKDVPMRLVPAGTFTMGSNFYDDEQPVHVVNLSDYYMDVYEVTNALYKTCVDVGGCMPPDNTSRYNDANYASHPVVTVDWSQAQKYCAWRGARLPTEAEWEKAARSTDARTYPWGNNAPDKTLLNFNNNVGGTSPVGSYPQGVSPYGLHDMAGNVWEWVADWYSETYYSTLGENVLNPQGPTSVTYRVVRGGSWNNSDDYTRSADRGRDTPGSRYGSLGFRCALSPP